MNQLTGKIKEIRTQAGISLVKINTLEELEFTSVIIESPEMSPYLQKDKEVQILFKETEIIIAKGDITNIGIQNKIPCVIKTIKSGEILCQLNLLFREIEINSIITKNTCEQLNLQEGENVFALVKSNEVSLSVHD